MPPLIPERVLVGLEKLDIFLNKVLFPFRKSNQQNLGTIKCSNLCTEIVEYSSADEVCKVKLHLLTSKLLLFTAFRRTAPNYLSWDSRM